VKWMLARLSAPALPREHVVRWRVNETGAMNEAIACA